MDDAQFDRSVRFASFLIGGVLLFAFGVEYLVSGLISLVVQCISNSFGQSCSGNYLWQVLSPVIGGAIVVFLAFVFFILAYQARRKSPAPTPPPP